jgi:phosphate transport system substrate-binding protein
MIYFTTVAVVFSGCSNYEKKKESVTSGNLNIAVDESYKNIIDSSIDVFESIYNTPSNLAKIKASYMPEAKVIQLLLADSVQAAILNRPLTEEELKLFEGKKRFPESVRIGVDGVAFILNPSRKDTVMSTNEVEEIMSGKNRKWKDGSDIIVVLDNQESCNARFVKDRFLKGQKFPEFYFASKSNDQVIDYVSHHPEAIGVISVSWIADRDDPDAVRFLNKVKVLAVKDQYSIAKDNHPRKPYQAYIYDQTYPYRRDVYAIRTGLKETLGTGFVSFLAGENGQLIIHKSGMVAAKAPTRIVRLKD